MAVITVTISFLQMGKPRYGKVKKLAHMTQLAAMGPSILMLGYQLCSMKEPTLSWVFDCTPYLHLSCLHFWHSFVGLSHANYFKQTFHFFLLEEF